MQGVRHKSTTERTFFMAKIQVCVSKVDKGVITMLSAIINWAVPFALGGVFAFATAQFKKNNALQEGLKSLLRADIIRCHEKYMERGEIPIYAKEALEKEYKAYHGLGGNDVATQLYEELLELKVKR